ncbi:hypothetical protein FM106_17805 [Brachybacterium faecium]|nr:hypothetical protein FM106_17805 [Brachybacterium faecium]
MVEDGGPSGEGRAESRCGSRAAGTGPARAARSHAGARSRRPRRGVAGKRGRGAGLDGAGRGLKAGRRREGDGRLRGPGCFNHGGAPLCVLMCRDAGY